MRAVVFAVVMVVAGSASAAECRFPGLPPMNVDVSGKVLKVKGEAYPLRAYGKEDAGGPGYRDGDTWLVDGTESGPLKNDDYLIYVRVNGKHSLYIVDDRTNPSLKGVCKG